MTASNVIYIKDKVKDWEMKTEYVPITTKEDLEMIVDWYRLALDEFPFSSQDQDAYAFYNQALENWNE